MDSLGGSIYNASLSVDMNDVDLLNNVVLTNNSDTSSSIMTTLNPNENPADKYFNFTQQGISNNVQVYEEPNTKEALKQIDEQINEQINNGQKLINKVRRENPNIRLTDQQILDLYNNFGGGNGMIMF